MRIKNTCSFTQFHAHLAEAIDATGPVDALGKSLIIYRDDLLHDVCLAVLKAAYGCMMNA